MAAACLASRPDWVSALFGSVVPSVPRYEAWVESKYYDDIVARRTPWVEMMVCLGALGGGTYDYIGYIGCLREKG